MFYRLCDPIICIGKFPGAGAYSDVGDHVEPGGFVFELDAGHPELELVVGVGEAGIVVLG